YATAAGLDDRIRGSRFSELLGRSGPSPHESLPVRVQMPIPLSGMGGFHFAVLASLRAAQLMRGCTARVDGLHKHTVIAQLEVSQGKVTQAIAPAISPIGIPAAAIVG